ncbi:hypothetical protein PINS_up009777 [Pythium insidiosum]|nr:hypothetical protein PINS_up009777 [Pythium insidiosum]
MNLAEAVKRGNCSMTDLVIEWRERFEENNASGAREVLNFVLQACGGQGECVPLSEPLEKLDMSDLVDYVVGDLEQSGDGYPLASRQRAFKKFYISFVDFWDAFVKECYESELLFTTEIVTQFVDWLTTLSSAEIRAIRHTTTVAAYALGSAMVDCIGTIEKQLGVVERQINAETTSKKKSPARKSPGSSKKLQQLQENRSMYEDRRERLLGMIQLLFNGVVVHRYRDVMADIRLESIRTLGNWIMALPDQFLKDNYMKYLGWVLNDKDASVRLGVVEILRELYENEEFAVKLELFTSRFLPRYLELCNDVDESVVQACIKLLIAVDKRSLISSDVELHFVEKLVFVEDNEDIRKAAAEFVCLQYDAFGVAESNRQSQLSREQLNTQAIALVEFAEEYVTNHGVPAEAVETMVDAFWGLDDCQVLQDWKVLLNLLLMDKNAPDLTSEQQTLLIRLLLASVGKIVSVDADKGSAASRKRQTKDKEEIAATFFKEIPNLLVRFQSDSEKLSLLVELIPLLTLSTEVAGLQPASVKSLLEKLKNAFMVNSEERLLKPLALSIHHLRKSEHEVIKRESDVIVHEIYQELLDKLEELLADDARIEIEAPTVADLPKNRRRSSKKKDIADSEFAVRITLARLACLITHFNAREFAASTKLTPSSSPSDQDGSDSHRLTEVKSQMESVAQNLSKFLHRRSKNVAELNQALLQVDTIRFALLVLYSDVLWQTNAVFRKFSTPNAQVVDASSENPESLIQDIIVSRSLLEESLIGILEMHLKKTEMRNDENSDDSEDTRDAQIAMEEIEFRRFACRKLREGGTASCIHYFLRCEVLVRGKISRCSGSVR